MHQLLADVEALNLVCPMERRARESGMLLECSVYDSVALQQCCSRGCSTIADFLPSYGLEREKG